MKLFLCKWSDGTGKIVTCKNLLQLFWALDFEGDPYQVKYKELKEDFAVNFKFITKSEEGEEYESTLLTYYDCEWDFLPELMNNEEGWKTFKSFFPYKGKNVDKVKKQYICSQMGWNPDFFKNQKAA